MTKNNARKLIKKAFFTLSFILGFIAFGFCGSVEQGLCEVGEGAIKIAVCILGAYFSFCIGENL